MIIIIIKYYYKFYNIIYNHLLLLNLFGPFPALTAANLAALITSF